MSILNPINDAVAWVITQLFNLLYPAFGAASGVTWLLVIVLLVVLIRLILVPLFIKQMHTQRAMTALGPKMAELRKKHKGDKEKLNAETMKLYQEAGVNPLMGCLPLVLQMPIFFALFDVLRFIAEWHHGQALKFGLSEFLISSAQHASIFGATISDKVLFTHGMNVSLEAKAVIVVAVVISMTTTFLTVRQSQKRGMMPSAGDNSTMGQSQKLMMYVMPLFALTGLYWQFGLVLYWVTTNVWTLGQQYVLLRKYPVGAAAAAAGGNVPVARKPRLGLGLGGAATRSALAGGTGTAGKTPQKPAAGDNAEQAGGEPANAGPSANGKAPAVGGVAAGESGAEAEQAGKAVPGKPGSAKQAPAKGAGQKSASPKSATGRPGGQNTSGRSGVSNGHKPAAEGGMLKRFGRSRPEPEPEPEVPAAKIMRQQRQRQSRSKRTGKR